jgi:hypothetical protein
MNPKERVLVNGIFQPFPERLREKAIAQGNLAPEADKGEPEDLLEHPGKAGKLEIAKTNKEIAKAQVEVEKTQKQQKLKRELNK